MSVMSAFVGTTKWRGPKGDVEAKSGADIVSPDTATHQAITFCGNSMRAPPDSDGIKLSGPEPGPDRLLCDLKISEPSALK
jgi:hypothetical protein